VPTLAELLRDAGYATAAVVAGPWLKRAIGLDRGFDHYDDAGIRSERGRLAPEVSDRAIAWLRARPDRPFFLFLNYFDPHGPFTPPAAFFRDLLSDDPDASPVERERARTRALYDGEVRFADHHLGRVLDALRALDLYDDTWIVVTADHGELLGEHGLLGHGKTLHEELLRIPLIEKRPRGEGPRGRSPRPVQLVDVLPTVAERLGIPAPPDIQGAPFAAVSHPIVAEAYPLPFLEGARGDMRALYEDGYKVLWRRDGRPELYDLTSQAGERRSLAWREPERAQRMEQRLLRYLEGLPGPPPVSGEARPVDAETREALRGLGYLDDPAPPAPAPGPEGSER
jgi:arylsulfatase A-like enzyme